MFIVWVHFPNDRLLDPTVHKIASQGFEEALENVHGFNCHKTKGYCPCALFMVTYQFYSVFYHGGVLVKSFSAAGEGFFFFLHYHLRV